MNRFATIGFHVSALVFATLVGCSHEAAPTSSSPRATESAKDQHPAENQDDDDTPVQPSELPAPVQATVSTQAKGATIHGLSKSTEDGRLAYELELVMADGHRKDMDIAPDGTILEIEEQVDMAKLPDAARTAIQQTAGQRTIRRIEAVSKGDGTLVGYEIGVTDGAKRSEFRIAVDGKPLPDDDD